MFYIDYIFSLEQQLSFKIPVWLFLSQEHVMACHEALLFGNHTQWFWAHSRNYIKEHVTNVWPIYKYIWLVPAL